MATHTINLHDRNVTEGYVDSIVMCAQVLRNNGEWDWNSQRSLDQDVKDLRNEGEDLDVGSILKEWEDRVEAIGYWTETEDGYFTVSNDEQNEEDGE